MPHATRTSTRARRVNARYTEGEDVLLNEAEDNRVEDQVISQSLEKTSVEGNPQPSAKQTLKQQLQALQADLHRS